MSIAATPGRTGPRSPEANGSRSDVPANPHRPGDRRLEQARSRLSFLAASSSPSRRLRLRRSTTPHVGRPSQSWAKRTILRARPTSSSPPRAGPTLDRARTRTHPSRSPTGRQSRKPSLPARLQIFQSPSCHPARLPSGPLYWKRVARDRARLRARENAAEARAR